MGIAARVALEAGQKLLLKHDLPTHAQWMCTWNLRMEVFPNSIFKLSSEHLPLSPRSALETVAPMLTPISPKCFGMCSGMHCICFRSDLLIIVQARECKLGVNAEDNEDEDDE